MTEPSVTTIYTIRFVPNDKGNPPGKLADAEIVFSGGLFDGMKLIGFGVWERRTGRGEINITFPARQYSINGERRSFALLRPLTDADAQNGVREAIIDAWQNYQIAQNMATDSATGQPKAPPPDALPIVDHPTDQAARQAEAPKPAVPLNQFEI